MPDASGAGWLRCDIIGRFDEFMLTNYFQPMDHDFMKRGYLLPEGCKDLIDVLVQAKQPSQQHPACLIDASKLKRLIDSGKVKPQLLKFKPT